MMQVSVGRILHYRLTEEDVAQITRRRTTGASIAGRIKEEKWPLGAQAHIGNGHYSGQILPMIACVVWPNEYGPNYHGVNGQVFLDGNDTLWVTSIKEGTENGTWEWPRKEESKPMIA
jgi:hypothetical protein